MIRCSNYKNATIGLYELGFVEAVNLLVGLIRLILMKVSNKTEMKMLLILTFSDCSSHFSPQTKGFYVPLLDTFISQSKLSVYLFTKFLHRTFSENFFK